MRCTRRFAPPREKGVAGMGWPNNKKGDKKMTTSVCKNCGASCWSWEEAFDKFGFNDGDGQIETWRVQAALERAGYSAQEACCGLHNTIIFSIKKDNVELIPEDAEVGYDNPRSYLPAELVELLDREFPA